mgnify:CR=1 FL=1
MLTKYVSIIIPCRNEASLIDKCLDSIIGNDYPKAKLEILVVDGMSVDGTRDIVIDYCLRHSFIKLLDNPRKIIPVAMNIGIRQACGDIVMKMDAHSTYPKDYISKCVWYLLNYGADNVGGVSKIVPRGDTTLARAIAHALAHPFASGNAYVKVGSRKPRWADTAAFGCYRREVFDKIGLFNEELARGSDMDFNRRLRQAGGKILLVPGIVINYYADSDLKSFWRHNFSDGVWITYPLKFGSRPFSWRHLVPFAFVLSLIGSAVLTTFLSVFRWLFVGITSSYLMANLIASLHLALREKRMVYLGITPIIFATRHIAQGLGALVGLILVLVPGKHWKGRRGWKV